jgi:hypothetical protein
MLLRHMVERGGTEPAPANTLAFLISYPVPRRLWAEKPATVGFQYPDIVKLPDRTNFGVGISGHGAYEGGLPIMVLYGFLVAIGIRFLDAPLLRQPDNPFLIAIQAAALPHILAFARGDFGIMTIETLICFIFIVPLGIGGRILFGTARRPSPAPRYSLPAGYQGRYLPR